MTREVSEILARAKAMLERGQMGEAEALYQQVLEADPRNAEAFNGLGVIQAQSGKLEQAISSFEQAVRSRPDAAEASNNLRQALALRHQSLGRAAAEQGKLGEAEDHYRQALRQLPDYVAALGNLGNILRRQGQLAEAESCFRRILELEPNQFQALNDLGALSQEQKMFQEAIELFRRALQVQPNHANAHLNLGVVLAKQGQSGEAAASFRAALAVQPDFAEAHNELGVVLLNADRREEALECFQKALAIRPDFPDAHNNLGNAWLSERRLDEAVACYRRAFEQRPDFVDAHRNCGFALLLKGEWAEGWLHYDWLWKGESRMKGPRWTGDSLAGRTILLHSDHGLGDALQFVRFAELLKRQDCRVIVECQEPLVQMLSTCPGVDRVVAKGDPRGEYDFHASLMSLPGVFGTKLDEIPKQVPYLSPPPELRATWNQKLKGEKALKVGIAWQGNKQFAADHLRSIPLKHFVPLSKIPGVRVFSLQMGEGREQLAELDGRPPIIDLSERSGDFMDAAAIIRNLDLVITSDSALAHLAGALGVAVWVAVPFAPDWRWLHDREDSPWYPTMRLFRQRQRGDWVAAFQSIAGELEKLA
jgi:tetratricopeptide (TPR) repeat protein